jgi:hypothetical protein
MAGAVEIIALLHEMRAETSAFHEEARLSFAALEKRFDAIDELLADCLSLLLQRNARLPHHWVQRI